MLKECVIVNGQIINVGPWDYRIQPFELQAPIYNEAGELVQEGVYEDRPTNPLPEGATTEQRDFEYDSERGWYEVGTSTPPNAEQRLASMESALLELLLGGL